MNLLKKFVTAVMWGFCFQVVVWAPNSHVIKKLPFLVISPGRIGALIKEMHSGSKAVSWKHTYQKRNPAQTEKWRHSLSTHSSVFLAAHASIWINQGEKEKPSETFCKNIFIKIACRSPLSWVCVWMDFRFHFPPAVLELEPLFLSLAALGPANL